MSQAATARTLRNHIAFSNARLELFGETSSFLGRAVLPFGAWLRPVAVATIVLELAAPVALLGGRIRTAWVLVTWTMHVAIAPAPNRRRLWVRVFI